jgi:hypothetical protein
MRTWVPLPAQLTFCPPRVIKGVTQNGLFVNFRRVKLLGVLSIVAT